MLRRRPVLPNPEPRLVVKPFDDRRLDVPAGRRPDRLRLPRSTTTRRSTPSRTPSGPSASSAASPGTYTWLPFGGGRRRCIGASFALLEMRVVLRQAFERFTSRRHADRAAAG